MNFLSRSRTSSAANSIATSTASTTEDDLDEGNKSILMEIINQVRNGTEFSKITLPTFILEPRSMCERLSDFFSFQDYLFKASDIQDPEERIVQMMRWVFSGHHVRPKGVKKPFNPILGEFFRCEWLESDGSRAYYICEQVSHHPPHSAFFYGNPKHNIWITGNLKPHARFLGNSAGTMMEGGSTIYLSNKDTYGLSNPNVYARSILFGKMFMELGDTCTLKSEKSDTTCTIEFKQKGFFGGSDKDGVTGKIYKESEKEALFKIVGKWSGVTTCERKDSRRPSVLFDGAPRTIPPEKIVADEEEQEEFESRRLWQHVAAAVELCDHKVATEEKSKIESHQRKTVKERLEHNIKWESRFFQDLGNGEWIPIILDRIKQGLDAGEPVPEDLIRDFIYAKPVKEIHKSFWVPKG